MDIYGKETCRSLRLKDF